MRVLIVDDDRANLRLLKMLLEKEGHRVTIAQDGQQGVDRFIAGNFDLVLMDVMMPVMDGYEAARRIKAECGDELIPLLFLTASSDESALARCVECGGDDFLGKPYSRVVLRSKIRSLERIRGLTRKVEDQRRDLLRQQAIVEKDLDIARAIMSKINEAGASLSAPCLSFRVDSMESFCGDIVARNRTPSGGLLVFLGDLTGHGLPAAVCAMPVVSTFYDMAKKGFGIGDIVTEINGKLISALSTGLFCAACLIEIDAAMTTATVWNGGLPEVLVVDGTGAVTRRIPSSHLALGVVDSDRDYRRVEVVELKPDTRLLAYSDGVVEAQNAEGQMYGPERLIDWIGQADGGLIDHIVRGVDAYIGDEAIDDDVSIVEIDCSKAIIDDDEINDGSASVYESSTWRASWSFGADTLKVVDPMPIMMAAWQDFPSPRQHRETIFTVLSELFTNALDHGVLGLDSRLKQSPDGFVLYYSERESRLAELEECRVDVAIEHQPTCSGGLVRISVEDSGDGFEVQAKKTAVDGDSADKSGRGVGLVSTLCDSLTYNEKGNRVEAVYSWKYEGNAQRELCAQGRA